MGIVSLRHARNQPVRGPGKLEQVREELVRQLCRLAGAVSSCPLDRQVSVVGLPWLLPDSRLPDSRLPDQPSHHIPGEQWLGHISLDERPAVDHLVLLQARVPLPDLVHPHHPVVMPLVRPGLRGGPGGRPGAAQRDNPHVRVDSGPDAILQPPKPEIVPSARILQLAAENDTEPDREAAD